MIRILVMGDEILDIIIHLKQNVKRLLSREISLGSQRQACMCGIFYFKGDSWMEKERDKSKRPRTRKRETDFQRIENPPQGMELSGYELEVREKLAEGLSPLDQIIAKEEALEKKKAGIQIRRWIHRNRVGPPDRTQ